MEKQFIVPALAFLVPLFSWIAVFVLRTTTGTFSGVKPWIETGIYLAIGLLILFSGIRCKQVGGPALGSMVRGGVLLVLAALTWWKAGSPAGLSLLVPGAILWIIALV